MERFAFVVHPIEARRDVARKYPIARFLPVRLIEWFLTRQNPLVVCEVKGVRSLTGKELEGWFIGCPLTPHQMVTLPYEQVLEKLEQCGRIALDLGAGIMGLGAFTSVVGDGGISLAKRLPDLAITTGNSYTVATAIEGVKEAARLMGHHIENSVVAVVGATGSIGSTCAEILSREAPAVALVGRDLSRLKQLAERLKSQSQAELRLFTDVATGLRDADVIITVTSAVDAIILPEYLKRGAVVCDVSRPRDVSVRVAKERQDVLVIEGGVVRVPGEMHLPYPNRPDEEFDFGFPPNTAYACMSETMMLALEGRYESFTLGKEVSVKQVDEISQLAAKHGFCLAGFRAFEKEVTPEQIARIQAAAGVAPTSISVAVPPIKTHQTP
ncbi:predicted dehydrogenase [Chthonomonas calidirosea]|uniref:Predicted dehydrogenase n=1 Tax=Chthonomonas calidirosea (strain DSM 23976 / ICMP 18418 / T49) TaxID=1303518 RepID=S0EW85_CHTCT|nr:Predicted dehydrogenase [Chthonomonas calidirosea]CCW36138.1 Predicted dehydrogenase [Chthonomonas calidirosea T49]CEK18225.1 predicted dehydrogenase [Chthonomonas calidirosea]